jgi:mRNA interferase MazF
VVNDVPDRGDILWLNFSPQSGREQAGRRPCVVLSPEAYNRRAGLALVCPITSKVKGYPFEVPLPSELPIRGVVLADQVRTVDYKTREMEVRGRVDDSLVSEILDRLGTLLRP